mgnify:CR=1 FL=1
MDTFSGTVGNDTINATNATGSVVLGALDSVDGSVVVYAGATFRADALTSVPGYVDVDKGATFHADALAECYGVRGKSLGFPGPWLLWAGEDGKYYAGCQRGRTYSQCLALAKGEPVGWTKEQAAAYLAAVKEHHNRVGK